jgi:hypothetical protein
VELAKRADADVPSLRTVDLRLAAANRLLSGPLAPMLSRRFLDIPQPDDPAAARGILDEASRQLALAGAALEKLSGAETQDEAGVAERTEGLALMRAFASAADAFWESPSTPPASPNDAVRDATLDLAVLMEDRRSDVASTARLWRAHLFEQRGDRTRALDLLPTELEPPVADPSISLYMRLLRCRLSLKDQGSFPATIALTNRLEVATGQWFTAPAEAAAARRTVAFVRRGMLQHWSAALTTADMADRAAWCDRAVQRIDQAHFQTPESAELLPLAWAAPPVIAAPAPQPVDSADDATKNAASASTNGTDGE